MAPANAKPWKQQAPILLAAALLLGLALPVPGSAAGMDACADGVEVLREMRDPCALMIMSGLGPARTFREEDVGKCCGSLGRAIRHSESQDDCACRLQKAFAESKVDLDRVCKLGVTKEKCQAKEDAEKEAKENAEKEAKAKADATRQREEELTKLGACDRFFERLAAGELSKISRDEDMKACLKKMETCPDTCQAKQ